MKTAYKKFVYPLSMYVKDLNGIAVITPLVESEKE